MEHTKEVLALLEEKKGYLEQFASLTQQMLFCSREDLASHVENRQKMVDKMEQISFKIETILQTYQPTDPLCMAVKGEWEGNRYSLEEEKIAHLSRQMRTLFSQIREDDLQASMRLRVEQEKILKQIRSANQAGTAKAARFYSATAAKNLGGSRIGKA